MSNEDFTPRREAARSPGNQAMIYSVAAGDSLWSIAQRYHVDMDMLMAANNLDENSLLTIGHKITIPDSRHGVHRITAGETLWEIACLAGTSVDQLQKLNPGIKANQLSIGDLLTVPANCSPSINPVNKSSRGIAQVIFNWPVLGKITSYFGWRHRSFHYGLDIAGKMGEPIMAAAGGVVAYSGWKGNYGKAVIIQHQDGRQTLYGHMQRIMVSNGESVARGEIIGLVGSTGHSTGPHVHFEVRRKGACLNPLNYLR